MVKLEDVTLVAVETRVHDVAKLTLEDCLIHFEFEDVIIHTDDRAKLDIPGASYFIIDDWPTKLENVNYTSYEMDRGVCTSHILFIEWDAGIFDPSKWDNEFLKYDFIGAPWGYQDAMSVGNGGFSLRSKRLVEYLRFNKKDYPFTNSAGDATLCRTYRSRLESECGFVWAPESVALEFAFECVRISRSSRHFGYHAPRNWPFVLDPDRLEKYVSLAKKNPYVLGLGVLDQIGIYGPSYVEDR